MAERRPVSKEEYERELRELGSLRREYDAKWASLRRIVANIRRWERIIADLETRFAELRRAGWPRLRALERREYLAIRDVRLPRARAYLLGWDTERTSIIIEIKREREDIRRLEAEIALKIIIVVPPKPIVAVVDSITGHLIVYLDELFKDRQVWLYHEERKEYIEPIQNVKIEYTFSVETEGHEDIFAEVTAWTIIKATDLDHRHAIKDTTNRLIRKAEAWFYRKFAPPPIGGALFGGPIPRTAFRPDFAIQEREEQAKHEGYIKQWHMEVTGEWTQRPRILKKGIGYYTTTEKDTWTDVFIYCEFSHEEEPRGTHRLPREAWEVIDP